MSLPSSQLDLVPGGPHPPTRGHAPPHLPRRDVVVSSGGMATPPVPSTLRFRGGVGILGQLFAPPPDPGGLVGLGSAVQVKL